jgi:hypothetical protein
MWKRSSSWSLPETKSIIRDADDAEIAAIFDGAASEQPAVVIAQSGNASEEEPTR